MLCFDLWQWEAWKSSPFVHYNQFTVESAVEGVDASPRSLFFAACFRAFTYVYAVVVGVAFLGSLPRVHVPLVTDSGTRTMYGYLVHAPALLLLAAQWRVPIRGYRRRPRGARVADVGNVGTCGGDGGVHDRPGGEGHSGGYAGKARQVGLAMKVV